MKVSETRKQFRNIGDIVCAAATNLKPPERLTVSQASEKYVELNMPGSYVGRYRNEKAPYMVEPMNMLQSRLFTGEVFCGPAQCGKTQSLLVNWVATIVMTQPMDMIFYSPSQANARDFSNRRIDRLHRYSKKVGAKLLKRRDADNKTDKQYESGMILTLSWPTKNEFAGKPVGLIGLTDYDRMDDDIEGDGSPYDLANKRTTTFKSFAMTLAESSPSRPIKNPEKWIKKSLHEAPPCEGILGLYNRGDRRRWYWPCPHCGSYFEGNFKMLKWEPHENTLDAAESVRMICPMLACGKEIHPDERYGMNIKGVWLKDGTAITSDGQIFGEAMRSSVASFWLNGVAASFVTWQKLVEIHIEATRAYERTGSEDALRKFYNNDLAEPYVPKSIQQTRQPDQLLTRAEPLGGTWDSPVVPHGVRFLVPIVDVQQSMFVVQVHGISPGEPSDITLIDRYNIGVNESGRLNEFKQPERVIPGSYLEDWDLITKYVLNRAYPLADNTGRLMMPKMVGCDSGGKAGVTSNAYEYYRKLRKNSMAARFHLLKGDGRLNIPRVRITHPDSNQREVKAAARGDVPVMMLNSTELKDMAAGRLDTIIPGKGMLRFPDWLPDWIYVELCAETRDEKGWHKKSGLRNEAWDLLYYAIGLCVSPLLGVESIDWKNPPSWAAEWDKNPFVIEPVKQSLFTATTKPEYDFAKFAQVLA